MDNDSQAEVDGEMEVVEETDEDDLEEERDAQSYGAPRFFFKGIDFARWQLVIAMRLRQLRSPITHNDAQEAEPQLVLQPLCMQRC